MSRVNTVYRGGPQKVMSIDMIQPEDRANEDKKYWLNRVWDIQKEIWALQEAKQDTFEAATSITPKYKAQTGGAGDIHKFDSGAILAGYIQERERERERVKEEILEAVKTIPDPQMRAIFIWRYINCREWQEVAAKLNYSERHVHRLHSEGLSLIRIDKKHVSRCH